MRVPIVVNEYIEVVAEAAAGLHVLEDRPGGACDVISRTACLGLSDDKRWDIQWLWCCAAYERCMHDWYTTSRTYGRRTKPTPKGLEDPGIVGWTNPCV